MKRIIYTDPATGAACVIVPSDAWLNPMKVDEATGGLVADTPRTVEELAAKDVPAGAEYHIIDAADLPLNPQQYPDRKRTYRNAWKVQDGGLVTDLAAAKSIHVANIIRLWAALGADEDDLQAALNAVGSPATVAELYAAWPAAIERRGG